jgi:hypothetical protein
MHPRQQQRPTRIRNYAAAAAAAAGLLAVATPVASASTTPPASASIPRAALTFVPPKVGPLSVDIAPTIINGQMTDPGLHVLSPAVSLPPIAWTLPPMSWPTRG